MTCPWPREMADRVMVVLIGCPITRPRRRERRCRRRCCRARSYLEVFVLVWPPLENLTRLSLRDRRLRSLQASTTACICWRRRLAIRKLHSRLAKNRLSLRFRIGVALLGSGTPGLGFRRKFRYRDAQRRREHHQTLPHKCNAPGREWMLTERWRE